MSSLVIKCDPHAAMEIKKLADEVGVSLSIPYANNFNANELFIMIASSISASLASLLVERILERFFPKPPPLNLVIDGEIIDLELLATMRAKEKKEIQK